MPPSTLTKVDMALTKYAEPIQDQEITVLAEPFGPPYQVLFDLTIPVDGWKEIRVWVHVSAENVTAAARLELRFMHHYTKGSFDYELATIPWNGFSSYINGYVAKPIIGKQLRLMCHPEGLPPAPYRLHVTYLLVR